MVDKQDAVSEVDLIDDDNSNHLRVHTALEDLFGVGPAGLDGGPRLKSDKNGLYTEIQHMGPDHMSPSHSRITTDKNGIISMHFQGLGDKKPWITRNSDANKSGFIDDIEEQLIKDYDMAEWDYDAHISDCAECKHKLISTKYAQYFQGEGGSANWNDAGPGKGSPTSPAPQGGGGDPWPDLVHDGRNPDGGRLTPQERKKLKKMIPKNQGLQNSVGPMPLNVLDINKLGGDVDEADLVGPHYVACQYCDAPIELVGPNESHVGDAWEVLDGDWASWLCTKNPTQQSVLHKPVVTPVTAASNEIDEYDLVGTEGLQQGLLKRFAEKSGNQAWMSGYKDGLLWSHNGWHKYYHPVDRDHMYEVHSSKRDEPCVHCAVDQDVADTYNTVIVPDGRAGGLRADLFMNNNLVKQNYANSLSELRNAVNLHRAHAEDQWYMTAHNKWVKDKNA